jgi:regulator of protease activity HflC (stomatin/prohibitin superfamily)
MTAERERRAAVAKSEGEKQALVLQAEGRRDAAVRDAEAREALAQAEANATRMVAEAAAGAGADALRYFIAEKYVRAIDALARSPNQKTFIMPLDMAGVAGTLAGVAEVAKGAFEQQAATRPASVPPAGRASS